MYFLLLLLLTFYYFLLVHEDMKSIYQKIPLAIYINWLYKTVRPVLSRVRIKQTPVFSLWMSA